MSKGTGINIALNKTVLVTVLVLIFAFLSHIVQAQTAITTITTTTVSGATSSDVVVAPSDAGNALQDDAGETFTINYGTGLDVRITNYIVSGSTFDRFLLPDTLVLNRRQSNDRLVNIWYEISSIIDNTPPTNDIIDVDPAAASDADAIYQTLALNSGYDNILVNDDDLGGVSNIEVETERVDVIWFQGIQTSSPTTAVFPILERGGNDNVAVAAITSLNADGTPASYGTLIGIGETFWTGGNAYTVDDFLVMRRETAGTDPIPLANIGLLQGQPSQNIEGMSVDFDELGISANQSIFGYSIFAADVVSGYTPGTTLTTGTATVAGGIDLTDISTFPSNTLSSDSGLDLIAGVSTAVSSDDNLIETKGPGGYKSALATWLKANEADDVTTSTEGSTVTDWQDHWVGNHDFTTGFAGFAPTYRSTTTPINFNPTVDFTSSSTSLSTANNDDFNDTEPYTNKGINIAFRTSTSDISTRQVLFEQGGNTRGINIYIRDGSVHVTSWNRSNDGAGSPWNDSGNVTTVSSTVSTNTEYIVTLEQNGNSSTTGTLTAYLNGQSIGVISNIGLLYRHTGGIELGGNDGNTRYDDGSNSGVNSFFGEISEFIYCNEPGSFPLSQRNRIESYMAIKYGITLDQSSPLNYVNSDGNVIFDATNSAAIGGFLEYNNDIAGIGRDDASELDQPASRSENTGSVVTVDKGASLGTDDTWLIWGNDGAALTETSGLTMPDTITSRLNRVWRAAERNEAGPTSVSFDITGLGLSTEEGDYSLIIAGNSSNADFSSATVVTGGTLVGNVLTFTGVDLDDGQYFTLGTMYFQCGPGGVFDNLALWLKANDGTSTTVESADIATWNDRSGNGNNATGVGGNQPSYISSAINYNAGVDFDETNTEEVTGSAGFHSVGYYIVFNADNTITSATDEDVLIGFNSPAGVGTSNEFGTLALGSATGAFSGEVITHAIGGSPATARWRRGISSANVSEITANRPYLIGIRDNAVSATDTEMYVDGRELANLTEATNPFFTSVNVDYEIGSYTATNDFATANHFDGQITEVISYSVRPTDAEHERIQSYLALKYGITLDQTSATNYVASDAGIIWNATDNSGYANDIAGIGRDDSSCLNQLQASSENTGSIVSMGLGEISANNASNPNSFTGDDAFLMWGNDGASATEANAVAYAEDVVTERMQRIWRADENAGTVGATDITFDLTGLGYTGSLSDYSLIISDASGLTSPTIIPASSFTSDVVTFSNVDLTDGQYFTLGTQRTACGPGGITTDLYMWLRADVGTSTTSDGASLTTWTDQSGNSTNATEATFPPTFRNNSTQNINFNPTIDFDGTDDLLNLGNLANIKSGATNGGDYTMIGVGIRDDGDYNFVLGSTGGTSNQDLHFGYRNNDSQATLAHWGNDLNVTTNGFASPTAPFILFGEYDGATGRIIEETRGGNYARNTDSNSTDLSGSQTNYIGNVENLGNYNGLIPEVIIYDNDISDVSKQQIMSYLAIKYGITLTNNNNNNGTTNEIISGSLREGDYLANGPGGANVVWTYANNSSYHNDVAGIGRDDDGCFVQKQSRAEDTDDILTVGLGTVAVDNASNANGFDDDGDYFIWGNDDGSTQSGSANTSDVPGVVTERMERIWKVQDTGNVGATELQFDLTGTSFPTGDASAYSLLVGNTATMADATVITGGTFDGSVLSFPGIDLTDGQFFTIGTAVATCGPGGVNTTLSLWLRADVEVFSDAGSTAAIDGNNAIQWNDQSSPAENGSEIDLGGGSPIEPTFETNEVNFNPVIRYNDPNSSNASYIETSSNTATTDITMISVFSTGQSSGTSGDFVNSPALVSGRTATATDADFGMGLENGTIYVNASSTDGFDAETTSTFNNNSFHFATSTRVSSSGAITVFVDSNQEATGTGSTGALSAPTSLGIGNHSDSDLQAQFAGDIAETIVFSSVLDSDERNRVESYLALKYGITRNGADDGGTGSVDERDYRAADGGVIWDYDGQSTTYYNDIFGIGRDDLSCFDQDQSKSENSDALVTFNNSGGFGTDDSFLVSGNDNATIEGSTTELPPTINSRLVREWRVQETGTVGSIELTYDLDDISGPTGVGTNNLSLVRLLVDDDGDFNTGATLIAPASIDGTNNTITFNVDFTDGQYYTLGSLEDAALPITLLSFTAETVESEYVQLNWSTLSETNNAYFTIERSSDAQNFERVGTREGAGNSEDVVDYIFTDLRPLAGTSYYRLKQTDFNGEFDYSELRQITFTPPEVSPEFRLYPNPAEQGDIVRLAYTVAQEQQVHITILTANGSVAKQFNARLNPADDHMEISTARLPRGLNFVRVRTESGTNSVLKLLVQ